MRQSRHLGKTLREVPKDAQTAAHILMLRAGYIQQLSAGVYVYLPLLLQTLNKISQIVREEMVAAGSEELLMPALQPKELWEESTRWERYTAVDGIMFAFKDRRGSTACLGPAHEEVVTDVLRREIKSYKDLPSNVFQIQTKFRDEIRPRFGLMRAREFIMKDAYSFDADSSGLDASYEAMRQAYHRICQRIGFRYRQVEADPGAIGGSGSHEFMVLAETGEDTILLRDMEGQLPIHVRPAPELVQALARSGVACRPDENLEIGSVLNMSDVGGIACGLKKWPAAGEDAVAVSLSHLRIDNSHPLAARIKAYQSRRAAKLTLSERQLERIRGGKPMRKKRRRPGK